MAKQRFLGLVVTCAMIFVACAPAFPAAADSGRPAGENLTVSAPYTVSGSETWDLVFVKTDGTLSVPSGATLNVKSIFLQGGSFRVNGGSVVVSQTTLGMDAVVMGDCTEFNLSGGATLTLTAPGGSSSIDFSQGGEAIVQVNASVSAVVTGGSKIQCSGGIGYTRGTPWTTSALSGYVAAGGRGLISLGGPATPYVEVSGGAQLSTTGSYGGRAADGKNGDGGTGGTGGGFSNGGSVSGFVGSGGEGRVEIFGLSAVVNNAAVSCSGGRGGDAGNAGAGSTTGSGSSSFPYYCGGGGGGGYGGGNGGSNYQESGKGGSATENVGAGGYAIFSVNAQNVTMKKTTVTLKGGDGGSPGSGGRGGRNPTLYYEYYSPGGGGGGFGGGGGASSYAAGSSGSASGNVGAGGEANMSVTCRNLVVDGLTLYGTGGGSRTGGTGGEGYGGGGGGGGYGGGGGGGGYYNGGGNGQATANVGSGGNATLVITTENVNAVNTTVDLDGGPAGNGGNGGRGGTMGGGGGGGYGGGGGAGYYNYNSPAGSGTCGSNVGRGGMTLFRLDAAGNLWLNSSKVNLTGGAGGNAGAGGTASSGGGGGGGYSGSGGGGQSGTGGDGTVNNWVGDGGDAQIELYCGRGSIPANAVQLDAKGGLKGDGLTKKGGGVGGAGKGRSTSNGQTPRNIPRLIPITQGPPDGTLYNNMDPRLTWMKCMDGILFPNTPDPVWNYEIQIDNDSDFSYPEDINKEIDADSSAYQPSGLKGGKYSWRVRTLYDGDKSPGWSAVHTFLKNGPPTKLRDIPPLAFAEDTNLTHGLDLSMYFTDDLYPDDLTYAISYEQDPTRLHAVVVDGHWVDFYTMTPQWYGKREFKVRVTDKGGISMESNNFTVTVTSVNDPPFFLPVPLITVTEDQARTFDMTEYVGDPDTQQTQLKLGVVVTSSYVTVEGLVLTLDYPRELGTDRINLSLSDGQWSVYTLVDVKVTPVNDRPVTLPMPDLTTNEDTKLVLDLSPFATDEEDGAGQLVWRAENVPFELLNVSIDGQNLMTITPLPDLNGDASFTMIVRDRAGAEAGANLTVKVLPVNDPPVVKGIPDIPVKVTIPYKLDVRQYVTDVDSDVSTQVRLTTNTLFASVSGFQITFQYPNDESLESEVVRISASDGRATGHQDITVTLSFPPTFTEPIGALSVEATRELTVDLARHVNDREDGPGGLKWAATRVDKTLIAVSIEGNGTLKIRSVGEKTGATEFILTATDTDGNKVNQTVQVTVTPKKAVFGGVAGNDLLLWGLPVVLVAAIVGGSAAFYLMASRRKRRLEEEQAAAAQQMLPTQEQRMVTLGPSAGPQAVPEGKVCFACGSKLVAAGPGTFQCTKCGRTQK